VIAAKFALVGPSGNLLVNVNYARDIVSVFSPVTPFPVIPWRETNVDDWPSFERIAARIRKDYPALHAAGIHIPSKAHCGLPFLPQARRRRAQAG